MRDILEIYKDLILSSYYDLSCGGNPQEIEGKTHGVCIDFSRSLIKELRKNGYYAGLISTLNDDGYNHAAVIYKNITTGEISIADPVTDVRKLTGLDDSQRENIIMQILDDRNFQRKLASYISEFGPIKEHLDNTHTIRENITEPQLLEDNLNFRLASNPIHIHHSCTTLSDISHIDELVEDPMKEACKLLYQKGICTSVSDNFEEQNKVEIFLPYTSLSAENRKILLEELRNNNPNYELRYSGGSWMRTQKIDELPRDENDDSATRGFVIQMTYNESDTMASVSNSLVNIASVFKKQKYMENIYTREDILRNKHLLEDVDTVLNNKKNVVLEKPLKSRISNKNLAKQNNLMYSKKYDVFFNDYTDFSRYLESLSSKTTKQEIAQEYSLIYDEESKLLFESSKDFNSFKERKAKFDAEENLQPISSIVTSTDIAEASKHYRIGEKIVNKFKHLIENVKEMWR